MSLAKTFTWLSQFPKHQYTLGAFFASFRYNTLDYQIPGEDESGGSVYNRAGRLLERAVTLGTLIGAGAAFATGGLSLLPAVGIAAGGKVAGFVAGGALSMMTEP